MRFTTSSLIAALLVAAACAAASAETTVKFGTFIPPNSVVMRSAGGPWIEGVERETAGRVKFQQFLGGSLSRAPEKQYELMLTGLQDATVVLPSYTQALFPDFSLLSLPFLVESAEEASVVTWRMVQTGLLTGLDKVQVITAFTNSNSAVNLNKKIASVDDLKGLKIRVAGPEESDTVVTLGAVPVGMGIGQVAESLNRGVIDGALAGWSALNTFKIVPLIKAHYYEPYGVRTFFIGMRKPAFDGLPEADRAIVMKHGGEALARQVGKATDDEDKELIEKVKNNIMSPSAAERPAREKLFQKFHDEWIAGQKDGRKKYDAVKKIIADVRAGR
jgi:TRAP-type C4-dicarboxylate transport system substrate-binding protein